MVSVEEPAPPAMEMDDGLKPPLVMPLGKPDSLPTARLTVPVKPLFGVTVTVNVVDPPGTTPLDEGITSTSKSGADGRTVMVRVGGLGSEFPAASMTVSEAVTSPGVAKVTLPGVCIVDVFGEPVGKIHEYLAAAALVAKKTEPPAATVTSAGGESMVPTGGAVV
jgi:hypothetical protein